MLIKKIEKYGPWWRAIISGSENWRVLMVHKHITNDSATVRKIAKDIDLGKDLANQNGRFAFRK